MANYVMQCKDCKNTYSASGSMREPASSFPCPICRSRNVRKVIMPTNIILKGEGWTTKPRPVGNWTQKKKG